MDQRFTSIKPLICETPEFGAEPCLLELITEYYHLHGIKPQKAKELAVAYVKEWTKLEAEAKVS